MTTTHVKTERKAKVSQWDEAISDARRKMAGLRFTIKTYQRMKDAGEPWPGAGVQELDRKERANG